LVVVAAIRFTITSWLMSGLPRQFWLMYANSRCSILFHLLVRRQVTDGDLQTGFLGQFLEFDFPQAHARAIAATPSAAISNCGASG
jgi:hypothetical protein